MKIFFVYVDWTTEETPRPFYVGKGTAKRVEELQRNQVWERIATKHGITRRVEMGTRDESFALEHERVLIAFHNTYMGWGANLTEGGEGCSGYKHTDEARRVMSEKNLGREAWNRNRPVPSEVREKIAAALKGSNNANFGVSKSEKTKAKLRAANLGRKAKPHSEEFKRYISSVHKGVTKSVASNEKRSAALVGKPKSDEARERMSKAKQGTTWSLERRLAFERKRKENAKIIESTSFEFDGSASNAVGDGSQVHGIQG